MLTTSIPDDVYYLLHNTSSNIKKSLNTLPTCSEAYESQFPGVFFTLITKYNIDKEKLYGGTKYLLFSVKLLEQYNYHINISDQNGTLSEYNTYYPFNLHEALKILKNNAKYKLSYKNPKYYGWANMNEVVFHDNIPMKYCCQIIEKPTFLNETDKNNYFINGGIKQYLPRVQLLNDEEPDMSKIPYYSYTMEDKYAGLKMVKNSSINWFRMLAKVANITPLDINKLTKQELIDFLRNKSTYYCSNRNKQNLKLFKDYIDTNKKILYKNSPYTLFVNKYKNKSKF